MVRRKLIVDTGMAPDDPLALACAVAAAASSPDVELAAVTCVWGRMPVASAADAVCALLSGLGRSDVPVYCGATEALVGGASEAVAPTSPLLPMPPPAVPEWNRPQKAHAAVALARLVSKQGDQGDGVVWQVVALGPLTNIALALRIFPPLLSLLGDDAHAGLLSMGGALANRGNSGLSAEFNWHCDPEAALIVTQSVGRTAPFHTPLLSLLPWEVASECGLSSEEVAVLLEAAAASGAAADGGGALQRLLKALQGAAAASGQCATPHAAALVVALGGGVVVGGEDDVVRTAKELFVEVEVSGRLSRGSTAIDWYGTAQSRAKAGRWVNARVATSADRAVFTRTVLGLLGGGAE